MSKTKIFTAVLIGLLLAGCTSQKGSYPYYAPKPSKKYPSGTLASQSSDIYKKNGDLKATMRPYVVMGKEYCPTVVSVGDSFEGMASWYGNDFHGKSTSNGEAYDMYAMTAAHKTLPMNTVVRVVNLQNSKSTVVRINDRGPFVESRIIDLSYAAANQLSLLNNGTANVRLEVLGFEPGDARTIDYALMAKGPKQEIIENFAVQIGAFEKFEGAVYTQKKYDSFKGYRTIIKDSEYNNKRLFRVWLSGFKCEAEARDFIAMGYFPSSFIVGD